MLCMNTHVWWSVCFLSLEVLFVSTELVSLSLPEGGMNTDLTLSGVLSWVLDIDERATNKERTYEASSRISHKNQWK